jgi:AcrR family transcriptional regulator
MSVVDTKDKILQVSAKLFARYGFHKTSMDEIAKISRKAKGSLYYHFLNKEDLFKEVVSREIEILKTQLTLIVENYELTASEKIKMYLIKRMEILHSALNYQEILNADFYEHFYFIDDLRLDLDIWEKEKIKSIISEGIKNGEFFPIDSNNNMDILLDVFIMVLRGIEIPFFLQNKYEKYLPHFDSLIGILIKGIS